MGFSLRFKIIFITMAILVFAIGATTLVSSYIFSREYSEVLQSKTLIVGQGVKSQLSRLLELGIPLEDLVGFEKQIQTTLNTNPDITYAMVIDLEGEILFHNDPSQHNKILTDPAILMAVSSDKEIIQTHSDQAGEFYDVFVPVFDRSGVHVGAIRLGFPVELISQRIRNLAVFSGIVALVSLLVAIALLVFILTAWVTKPLTKLLNAIHEIRSGEIGMAPKVEINSKDEIGELSSAFNTMTSQLHELINTLEDQVQARTAELSLSIEVGQRAAAIRELNELLPMITEFIRQKFELYHTQVYFMDNLGQNLVLEASTGQVGRELLARHHTLPVGRGSIVGRVAAEGQAIVVPDTTKSNLHKPNPLLPETRSEVAVPLMVEGRVIGVLDMQATQANTFTEKNRTVFEAMGIQLAIAIHSAQQWTLAQEAQERSEQALRQLTRQTWTETLAKQQQNLAFAYDLSAVKPVASLEQNGGVVVPVVIQNQTVGQLAVHPPEGKALSADEQALLSAVSQQLAQKAENIRLFEETQQRATREQIARQIADKIRASRDIEMALKTAATELSKALGTAKAVVSLQITELDQSTAE